MNRQPYTTPPRHWEPCLTPWWINVCRPFRARILRKKQRMRSIEVQGKIHIQKPLQEGAGILITPNHSFHYDAVVLWEVAHRVGRMFHFMTAWQVFAMSNRFDRWSMQRHGCFSIDRESNDMSAFRQAVSILQNSPYPLVVFPEGDVYHSNDRVTPFREGAAAMALSAAKRAKRKIVCVPCALKCWYTEDPTPQLLILLDQLEHRLMWKPRADLPIRERVYRIAEGIMSLKEIEYLGKSRAGTLAERQSYLADFLLARMEKYYSLRQPPEKIPERVRELRRIIIQRLGQEKLDRNEQEYARAFMEDLFLVIQLYSYPSDYMRQAKSIERIAETLDKFEEDILQRDLPSVRGSRRVVVRFGEPIELPKERQKKDAIPRITFQNSVQKLLDEILAERHGA